MDDTHEMLSGNNPYYTKYICTCGTILEVIGNVRYVVRCPTCLEPMERCGVTKDTKEV